MALDRRRKVLIALAAASGLVLVLRSLGSLEDVLTNNHILPSGGLGSSGEAAEAALITDTRPYSHADILRTIFEQGKDFGEVSQGPSESIFLSSPVVTLISDL